MRNAGGKWLRIDDAALESLLSVAHLRRCIRDRRLKADRTPNGREIRILREDLDRFLQSSPVTAA